MPNEFAEVLVSEQTAVSIKVTVASGGLAALAGKLLRKASAEDRDEGPRTIVNRSEGDVLGTLLQIGTVKNMHLREGR
ncbi:hypothetical protein ACSHWB_21265 [Lentzea sp. HUAS TT2]|uniref:hypothetical protein n=1 Tax=Lentzea sp. HUAS TT2 TaxID=3447454 RepID=UPI003F7028F1